MIVRVKHKRRYTVVGNDTVEDDRLSFKALGLLVYLLSRPDDWHVDGRQLAGTHCDGKAAVFSALKELEKAGYVTRERVRQEGGTFTWEHVVSEQPDPENRDVVPPGESPECPERPDPGFPDPDNRDSKDQVLVDQPPTPTGGESPALFDAWFDEWWESYPKKVKKKNARRAFRRRVSDGTDADRLIEALADHLCNWERSGTEPRFVPDPTTWLNQRRDEDELPEPPDDSWLSGTGDGLIYG